ALARHLYSFPTRRSSDLGHFLNLLENVEPPAAAIALQRVGRIGDELQLLQHELRNHQRAVDEPGLAHVGDPAVDDHARVQNLVSDRKSTRLNSSHQIISY